MPQMTPKSGGRGRVIRQANAKRSAMSTNKKTPKHGLEAGDPDAWEPAQLVVARPTSVMLSVRVPAELVIQLEAYAEKRSITVSDSIRLAVERIVRGVSAEPTYALLGTTGDSALRLAGPTVMVHAVSSGSGSKNLHQPGRSFTGTPAA